MTTALKVADAPTELITEARRLSIDDLSARFGDTTTTFLLEDEPTIAELRRICAEAGVDLIAVDPPPDR